ncbi:hypothetical protein H9P43_002407 [Blastocladiella emersonii ATCC 22665]|nr:hypothetical protein H9P43_002407 [Blastocladiella emersonii ATCC 22665]
MSGFDPRRSEALRQSLDDIEMIDQEEAVFEGSYIPEPDAPELYEQIPQPAYSGGFTPSAPAGPSRPSRRTGGHRGSGSYNEGGRNNPAANMVHERFFNSFGDLYDEELIVPSIIAEATAAGAWNAAQQAQQQQQGQSSPQQAQAAAAAAARPDPHSQVATPTEEN